MNENNILEVLGNLGVNDCADLCKIKLVMLH